ncbi:MAG: prepilin-type N-terminal cleavage/methylation domain-containing protein [Candidatus Electronema sp. V4]|uniref:prepilin-type N-terminal cleavage/methylation domain-containing protein n=1 Tax=Candidatus Electronema sp. V4 TaxID=3454756 RepID=UPI0040559A5C
MKINKLRILASDKGFTLIELMIVIAIIGILAAIAIPNFISYRDKSFCSAAETDAGSLQGGLSDYFAIPSNQTYNAAKTAQYEIGTPTGNEVVFTGSQTLRLSGTNVGTIRPAGTGFVITVQDGSGRCPENYRKASPRWTQGDATKAPFIYSVTM